VDARRKGDGTGLKQVLVNRKTLIIIKKTSRSIENETVVDLDKVAVFRNFFLLHTIDLQDLEEFSAEKGSIEKAASDQL
jgi:hypothetical protein